ncbi:hypothetical protein D3C77_507020 [compost metagenome]
MKQATIGATKNTAQIDPSAMYQAMHEAIKPANGRLNFFCCEVIFMLVFRCDFPDTPRKKGIEETCRDPLLASVAGLNRVVPPAAGLSACSPAG